MYRISGIQNQRQKEQELQKMASINGPSWGGYADNSLAKEVNKATDEELVDMNNSMGALPPLLLLDGTDEGNNSSSGSERGDMMDALTNHTSQAVYQFSDEEEDEEEKEYLDCSRMSFVDDNHQSHEGQMTDNHAMVLNQGSLLEQQEEIQMAEARFEALVQEEEPSLLMEEAEDDDLPTLQEEAPVVIPETTSATSPDSSPNTGLGRLGRKSGSISPLSNVHRPALVLSLRDNTSSSNHGDEEELIEAAQESNNIPQRRRKSSHDRLRNNRTSSKTNSHKPQRRVPARSKTVDARISVTTMPDTHTTKILKGMDNSSAQGRRGSLRRNRTVDERMNSSSENGKMRRRTIAAPGDKARVTSTKQTPRRNHSITSLATAPLLRSLRRNKTVDERVKKDQYNNEGHEGTAAATTEANTTHSAPTRRSVRRSWTADERLTPRRNSSSGGGLLSRAFSKQILSSNRSQRSMKQRRTSSSQPSHSLNIFGNELVSTEFILTQLNHLETNPEIVNLELEDCLVTSRSAKKIPLRLKKILQQEQEEPRPWEGIRFVDELLDGFAYKDFKRRRKQFVKALDGVCAQQVIPVEFKLKVHLIEEEEEKHEDHPGMDDSDKDPTISSTGKCRPAGVDYMTHLIQEFQCDSSITCLSVTSNKTSIQLLQALTDLLQCDYRVWETITLRLSCDKAPLTTATDTAEWHKNMQAATRRLQQTAKARGIRLYD